MTGEDPSPRAHRRPFEILWRRKGLIATLVVGVGGVAAAALTVIPPRYTAEALIAFSGAPAAGETQNLRSRALAEQVVDALALDRDSEFSGPTLALTPPAALATAWARLVGDDKDARTLAVERVQRRLSVEAGGTASVIRLDFDAARPDKAALIANAFADLYIRGQREARLAALHLDSAPLAQQISRLEGELAEESAAATALRSKSDPGAGRQLAGLDAELAQAEQERSDAETALDQAKKALKLGGGRSRSLDVVQQSPFLQEMRQQEAKILGRIAELSVGYRDDSPALVALKDQLAGLRLEIDHEIAGAVETLAAQAARATAHENSLRQRMRQASSGRAAADEATSQLERRQKVIEAKNVMLDSVLSRYAELTNRAQTEAADCRIAARATPPARPSFPRPASFFGIALGGSLGVALPLAFLLERLRGGFRSTRQLREALGLPTLGIIPALDRRSSQTRPADILVDQPEAVYAEAIRSAQLTLLKARHDPAKALLITSSLPNEGKSAFAVSLGRSLALAEKKVLLVDCDLRRPAVAGQLDAPSVPGITDYVGQRAALEEIVRHDSRSGLDFVTAGSPTQEPQRVLADPLVAAAFAGWLKAYEVVLIDTPPVMIAFDAVLLAAHCAATVYAVEWGRTPVGAVQAGIDQLRAFDMAVAGVVLTKVDLKRQPQYDDYVDFCFRSAEYYGS